MSSEDELMQSDHENGSEIEENVDLVQVIENEEVVQSATNEDEGNRENEDETDKKTVDVKPKRVVRNPQPKLNEQTLKSNRGLSALPKYFDRVKFKGKGHEESDLNVVMKTYEYWCHRLFPKYPFDACIDRLEKLGQKRGTQVYLKRIRLGITDEQTDNILNDNDEDDVPAPNFVDVFNEATPSSSAPLPDLSEDVLERIRLNRERAERIRKEKLEKRGTSSNNQEDTQTEEFNRSEVVDTIDSDEEMEDTNQGDKESDEYGRRRLGKGTPEPDQNEVVENRGSRRLQKNRTLSSDEESDLNGKESEVVEDGTESEDEQSQVLCRKTSKKSTEVVNSDEEMEETNKCEKKSDKYGRKRVGKGKPKPDRNEVVENRSRRFKKNRTLSSDGEDDVNSKESEVDDGTESEDEQSQILCRKTNEKSVEVTNSDDEMEETNKCEKKSDKYGRKRVGKGKPKPDRNEVVENRSRRLKKNRTLSSDGEDDVNSKESEVDDGTESEDEQSQILCRKTNEKSVEVTNSDDEMEETNKCEKKSDKYGRKRVGRGKPKPDRNEVVENRSRRLKKNRTLSSDGENDVNSKESEVDDGTESEQSQVLCRKMNEKSAEVINSDEEMEETNKCEKKSDKYGRKRVGKGKPKPDRNEVVENRSRRLKKNRTLSSDGENDVNSKESEVDDGTESEQSQVLCRKMNEKSAEVINSDEEMEETNKCEKKSDKYGRKRVGKGTPKPDRNEVVENRGSRRLKKNRTLSSDEESDLNDQESDDGTESEDEQSQVLCRKTSKKSTEVVNSDEEMEQTNQNKDIDKIVKISKENNMDRDINEEQNKQRHRKRNQVPSSDEESI